MTPPFTRVVFYLSLVALAGCAQGFHQGYGGGGEPPAGIGWASDSGEYWTGGQATGGTLSFFRVTITGIAIANATTILIATMIVTAATAMTVIPAVMTGAMLAV